jgi:hypothetical protein
VPKPEMSFDLAAEFYFFKSRAIIIFDEMLIFALLPV